MPEHVTLLGVTKAGIATGCRQIYSKNETPVCIGQKQKWFLLRLDAPDDAVRLDIVATPEFKDWKWVSYQSDILSG